MFPFKKPPSRIESAKKAVAAAVSDAAHSISDTVSSAATTVSHAAESLSERAHDLIENVPAELHLSEAAEKLGALKAGAVAGVAGAGASVAEKVASARDKTASEVVPEVRRARQQAQEQINAIHQQAHQYKRDLEKAMAREQAHFESEKERLMGEAAELKERARRRKNKGDEDAVTVPVAPTDEIVAYDEDGDSMPDYDAKDYRDDYGKGGGNSWLWIGGLLLVGAGALYYLFSTTSGKRSKAAIQDRITQVKAGDRETTTQRSDAGEPVLAEVSAAANEAFDRSNEKIGAPDKTVEAMSEVGDKVADGIEAAGEFIADKLEAAGAGAKSVAGSAAAKLDEVKSKTAPAPDEPRPATLGEAVPTGVPADAVIVEVVTDEPLNPKETEEVLAEVEETVQQIEDSVHQEKNKSQDKK